MTYRPDVDFVRSLTDEELQGIAEGLGIHERMARAELEAAVLAWPELGRYAPAMQDVVLTGGPFNAGDRLLMGAGRIKSRWRVFQTGPRGAEIVPDVEPTRLPLLSPKVRARMRERARLTRRSWWPSEVS